jgi:hypothetical protein
MAKRVIGASWLIWNGPSRKSLLPPYVSKKGWLLVCELMPGHHDNEIAAAGDKTDIREAQITNEAIYVCSCMKREGGVGLCAGKPPVSLPFKRYFEIAIDFHSAGSTGRAQYMRERVVV